MSQEEKTDIFRSGVLDEGQIPKRKGRNAKFDWAKVFESVPPQKYREIDTEKVSISTLIQHAKKLGYVVRTRTDGTEKRVFVFNPRKA